MQLLVSDRCWPGVALCTVPWLSEVLVPDYPADAPKFRAAISISVLLRQHHRCNTSRLIRSLLSSTTNNSSPHRQRRSDRQRSIDRPAPEFSLPAALLLGPKPSPLGDPLSLNGRFLGRATLAIIHLQPALQRVCAWDQRNPPSRILTATPLVHSEEPNFTLSISTFTTVLLEALELTPTYHHCPHCRPDARYPVIVHSSPLTIPHSCTYTPHTVATLFTKRQSPSLNILDPECHGSDLGSSKLQPARHTT